MNCSSSSIEQDSGNVSSITTGLPTAKPASVSSASLTLPRLGIEVDADEIEVVGDLRGDEAGRQAGAVEAPVDQADRDQVAAVVLDVRRPSACGPTGGRCRAGAGSPGRA